MRRGASQRMRARRTRRRAANARSLACDAAVALLARTSCGCPRRMASRAMPNQPASSPSTTVFLRLVAAGRLLRHVRDRAPATPRAGVDADERQRVGRDAGLGLVDDDRVAADRQLGAELEEVVPVERDGDVERAAGVEHRAGREAHPARRLAAADLRAEALGHHRVVALAAQRRDQRLAGAHDAVSARAGHSDDEIVDHAGFHSRKWEQGECRVPDARRPCAGASIFSRMTRMGRRFSRL